MFGYAEILIPGQWFTQVKCFISMHMYLALGFETTLFHTILDVVVSEVGVLASPG